MSTKRNGLLALLGLGALAYWRYRNSTPEEKQKVKDQINAAKDNVTKLGNDLKRKANEVASQVESKTKEFTQKAENKA